MPVLKGNKSFYDYDVSDYAAYNIKSWLEYGLLETGAYTIAQFSNPATSGFTNLQKVHDDRFTDGRVYEGMGAGWVWENDVTTITNIQKPLVASGISVNGSFYLTATTSGIYQHKIDFKNGRVIFNSPVNSGIVRCEYTFKDVAVYLSDDSHWKTIVQEYEKVFNNLSSLSPSGMTEILKENRVWLPAIVVEVENRTNLPLQLGGGDINEFQVGYHIFSDKSFSNRRLVDLLNNQYQHVLKFFDVNNMNFPYNSDGTISSGAITYPNLANPNGQYFWTNAYIKETDGGPRNSTTDIFRAECTHTIDVDRYVSTF